MLVATAHYIIAKVNVCAFSPAIEFTNDGNVTTSANRIAVLNLCYLAHRLVIAQFASNSCVTLKYDVLCVTIVASITD